MGDSDEGKRTIPFSGVVHCVQCSPFNFCDALVAISSYNVSISGDSSNRLTIAKLFPKRKAEQMLQILKEYQQDTLTTCLCWSPKTFVDSLPYSVILFTGSLNGNVSLISTDLKDENELIVLGSHRKAVNAIAADMDQGALLASVGDDCRFILWNVPENKVLCEFPLKSAGTDVKFHRYDSTKVLVAEKYNIIRFYDIVSLNCFMTIDCVYSPIKSLSWSSDDITKLHVLAENLWIEYNTTMPHEMVDVINVADFNSSISCGTHIAECPVNSSLVAVTSGNGRTVKIYKSLSSQPMKELPKCVGTGISWLISQPVLVCGGDCELIVIDCSAIS